MQTLHSAFRCVLFVFVLFSCNSTKEKTNSGNPADATSAPVGISPQETVDVGLMHAKFIDEATQHFLVTTKKITSVESKGGLKLTVNPRSLEREDGSLIEGDIEVSIVELTNANDLFKSNAATVSNGRLLVSGGSYFIGMKNGGRKVRIKNGEILEAQFPFLKKDEMELFYGERDANGNMNWKETGSRLKQEFETVSFNTRENDIYGWNAYPDIQRPELAIKNRGHYIFPKFDTKVVFMNRMMTINEMVKTMQRWGKDRIIDTIYYNWYNLADEVHNIRYARDPKYLEAGIARGMLFRIISSKESIAERDSFANLYCEYEEKKNEMYAKRAEKMKGLESKAPVNFRTQLRKTYAPAAITELGWINCDRFYNPQQQTETELELPYALNNSRIEYFVLFNSFSGLLNDQADFVDNKNVRLQSMPLGEKVTLVAFTKKNGILYQAKEDFVITRNMKLPVKFKEISKEELTKIFGSSVKI